VEGKDRLGNGEEGVQETPNQNHEDGQILAQLGTGNIVSEPEHCRCDGEVELRGLPAAVGPGWVPRGS
jgi:hypothetical protein